MPKGKPDTTAISDSAQSPTWHPCDHGLILSEPVAPALYNTAAPTAGDENRATSATRCNLSALAECNAAWNSSRTGDGLRRWSHRMPGGLVHLNGVPQATDIDAHIF